MAYNPGSYSYGIGAVTPQQFALGAQRAARPEVNLPTTGYSYQTPTYASGGGYAGGGTTLSSLLNRSPEELLDLRTKYRIAQNAPALAENARQFDVGNAGTNERYYAGLGEQQRQSDTGTQLSYDQLANQQLLAQLEAWSRLMAGLT